MCRSELLYPRRTNDACGMTLNSLSFSLPASPYCMSGEASCTGGLVGEVDPSKWTVCCTGSESRLPGTNYFGFDGLGDGAAMRRDVYDPNQNRSFHHSRGLESGYAVVCIQLLIFPKIL